MSRESQVSEQTNGESAQAYLLDRDRLRAPLSRPMVIRKADVPIRTLADWRLYASPRGGEQQWRDYRASKELARAWCPDGIGPVVPHETRALLASHTAFSGFSVLEVLPEHHVRFDELPGEPPTTDLMAVGTAGEQEFVMGVVGKGDEPFGAYVNDELVSAARRMANEILTPSFERIARLAAALLPARLGGEPHLGELRTQLPSSLAATLAFATQRSAPRAAFVVHEFRTHMTNDTRLSDNQRDLERMVERITSGDTTSVPMNHLLGPFEVSGNDFISGRVELFVGKVRRELLALDF
jgi:hypothetical protein